MDTTGLERYEPPEGICVAFGRPAHGLEGFRRSHREAVQAARVASLARGVERRVVGYAQVELVSLLSTDVASARAFVATQLGALAAAVSRRSGCGRR